MNALVSVCHFCELHGPKIIFTTQAFRNQLDAVVCPSPKIADWKYGQIECDVQKLDCRSEICSGCDTFAKDGINMISNDDLAKTTYISSHVPVQQDIFCLAKQASIRSLSCEVCPEREGAIYFGDSIRGQVISYTFFLKDLQARGGKRWYSMVILMKDKMFLLSSWTFLVNRIKDVIQGLQQSADKVYASEEERMRLKRQGHHQPGQKFKRDKTCGNPRSLRELVDDPKIWSFLHTTFLKMLTEGAIKLKEVFAQGPKFTSYQINDDARQILVSLCSSIGRSSFESILNSIVIGQHIIVTSDGLFLARQFVSTIQCVVPPELVQVSVVESVQAEVKATIFIMEATHFERVPSQILTLHISRPKNGTENMNNCFAESLRFEVINEKEEKKKYPQLVQEMARILLETSFSSQTASIYIATLIDAWSCKAKTWKDIQHDNSSKEHLSASVHPKLLAIGALECDMPLLEYWATHFVKVRQ